ncbi:hypothetical protein WJX73_003945 [Symbiochloris irregularis]|uniref:PHD-type domain-containing protein n=1 Tax=Symbiochloris irregularis TaxID=706552 RepID=A0AAW1PRD1_9CHLO
MSASTMFSSLQEDIKARALLSLQDFLEARGMAMPASMSAVCTVKVEEGTAPVEANAFYVDADGTGYRSCQEVFEALQRKGSQPLASRPSVPETSHRDTNNADEALPPGTKPPLQRLRRSRDQLPSNPPRPRGRPYGSGKKSSHLDLSELPLTGHIAQYRQNPHLLLPQVHSCEPARSSRISDGQPAIIALKRQRIAAEPHSPPHPDGAKRRRRAKTDTPQRDKPESPYAKLVTRVRAQLQRMRQEQALLDAYEGDGWRGAKREAVRPTAELDRAAKQMEKSRQAILECIRLCEEAQGDRPIPADRFDEDGELDEQHIFCARCTDFDTNDEENDIVLCDGPCNRAYHFNCVTPPITAADLKEDEGWLCSACDAKADIVHLLNDALETDYTLEDPWTAFKLGSSLTRQQQGPDIAASADGNGVTPAAGTLLQGVELPSDTDDSSFRSSDDSGSPLKQDESSSSDGDAAAGPGAKSESKSKASHDSGDSSDRSASSGGSSAESSSDSDSADTIESEGALRALSPGGSPERGGPDGNGGEAGISHANGRLRRPQRRRAAQSDPGQQPNSAMHDPHPSHSTAAAAAGAAVPDSDAGMTHALADIVVGRRQRKMVDYAALAAEMFGDAAETPREGEGHTDDDWSPRAAGVGLMLQQLDSI